MIDKMRTMAVSFSLGLISLLSVLILPAACGQAVISEFLASNQAGLTDEDGEHSDWIEIHNPGARPLPLLGWSLTDDASRRNSWNFPDVTVAAGSRLVVFASAKDRRSLATPLHTSFRLTSAGEYLALVRPDGTLASEFAPAYPPQVPDVSYGLASRTTATAVVTPTTPARFDVPADGSLGSTWTTSAFDDTRWSLGTAGVGFETGQNEFGDGVAGDILTDNPLAYWRLSETSGTSLANLGSRPAKGQALNGPLLGQEGPRPLAFGGFESDNRGVRFDGINDRIDVPADPASNPPSFSIEAWARPLAAGGRLQSVVTCRNSSPTRGFAVYAGDDGRWQLSLGNGATWSVAVGPAVVVGQWAHLVGTYDSATQSLSFFVDGQLVATLTSAYQQNATRPLRIGAGRTETTGDYFFNGDIDEVALFDRVLTATDVSRRHALAVTGAGAREAFPYQGLFPTDVRAAMHNRNSSVRVRIPFEVTAPEQVAGLRLRARHDDGFAIWLNGQPVASAQAPATLTWDAAATAINPTRSALEPEEFDLTSHLALLRPGTNVLAVQGMNASRANPDFLFLPQLDVAVVADDTGVPVYFTTPTAGRPNTSGVAHPGPLITDTTHLPARPSINDDLVVTCRVMPTLAAVSTVQLSWRVMFNAVQQTPMFDDGQHGDGAAGDGSYGVILPKSAYTQGQLVRWYFTATDVDGQSSRWPLFTQPVNSPEFSGTMIADPRVTTTLPVWYWFAPSTAAANTRTGIRGAVFFNGELNDNVLIRQRGAATSSGSRKFDFNTGFHALINKEIGRVEEANINGTSSDPTLIRPSMAFETFRRTGHPAGMAFPLMLRANAAADTSGGNGGLAYFVEQVDERMLDRVGLDREGALYKLDQRSDLNPVFTDTSNGVQKRTRLTENNNDLQAVVDALKLSTPAATREQFMFDHFDVGNLINYLAVRAIINDSDDVRKNFYFYRDTNDTREWMLIPWDKDWSFGIAGDGGQWWTHPFFGDRTHAKDNASQWNLLWEALHTNPRTRAMYLRRLRTLMDTLLQPPPPAPAGGYDFEKRADGWFAPLDPHTSQTVSSIKSWLPQRRTQLFVSFLDSPANANASRRLIPATRQDPEAIVTIGAVDANPASGNQEEEFIELINPGATAVDISGWQIQGGVSHTLKPGSVLLPGGSLYLARRASAFRARTSGPRGGEGRFVQGNYAGSLSARGEALTLLEPRDPTTIADDRVVATVMTPAQPTPAQRSLRLTEIMFHPAAGGTFEADEYEYLELTHSGETTLDLTGATFTHGLTFTFDPAGPMTSLATGARLVLVKNPAAFAERYGAGRPVAGTFTGSLANSGERLRLIDGVGEEVLDVTYGDDWQPGTDGGGYALVLRDPASEPSTWSQAATWRSSLVCGGSPGAAEAEPAFRFAPGDLEVLASGDTLTVNFLGAPGSSYLLESSPDLNIWQEESTLRTDATGRAGKEISPAPVSSRFYRVRCANGQ